MPECGGRKNDVSLAQRLKEVWEAADGDAPCGCCSRCMCVSETEFACVLEYLLDSLPKEKILEIIRKAKAQLTQLERENPEIFARLKGEVRLRDLLRLDKETLPFDCLFLENGKCAIEPARPLKCRDAEGSFYGFMLLRRGDTVIIRRPAPMFYYFSLVFKDENELDTIRDADFFRGITELGERAYIDRLFEKNNGAAKNRP